MRKFAEPAATRRTRAGGIKHACAVGPLLAVIMNTASPISAQYYANGLHKDFGDPTVIYQVIGTDGGYYYGTATGAYKQALDAKANGPTGIYIIYRSRNLADLFNSTDTIAVPVRVTPKTATADSPGLFYYQNKMYLSYHSDKLTRVAHSVGPDPEGTWTDDDGADLPGRAWVLFFRTGSRGQPLNQLYGFYTAQSDVHVVKMTDPAHRDFACRCDTVISKSVDPSAPDAKQYYRPWEHLANIHPPGVNEGPNPFTTTDTAGTTTTWVNYSANSYRSDAYVVGILKYVGSDTDDFAKSTLWVKQQNPFFGGPGQGTGDNVVYSTGANTMVRDRTGQLWNVYGARFHSAFTNGRELRMDPVAFDANGELLLQQPGPSAEGQLLPLPGSDAPVTSRFFTVTPTARSQTFSYQDPRIYYSAVSATPTTKDDPYQADQKAPWTDDSASTSYKRTNAPYAYYMIQFVGQSIAINAPTGNGFGSASIFKDGVLAGTINFGQAASGPALVTNYATAGEHTLLVMVQADDPANPTPLAKNQPNHQVGLASFSISLDAQPTQ